MVCEKRVMFCFLGGSVFRKRLPLLWNLSTIVSVKCCGRWRDSAGLEETRLPGLLRNSTNGAV